MLKVCNISKNFGPLAALSNVSFEVNNGKTVALLGENGAGKSTLLRIISGYFDADNGDIYFDDLNLKENRTSFLTNIGYVREISSLYPDLTVYEFLQFVAEIHKIPTVEAGEKIFNALKLLELENVINQKTGTLSKGYRKRLDLASVLIYQPKIILLDEPTEGLDPTQKNALRTIIRNISQKCIVIISTHTMEDVEAMADHVALLHNGKLLKYCSKANFKKIAKNDLLQSFIKIVKN